MAPVTEQTPRHLAGSICDYEASNSPEVSRPDDIYTRLIRTRDRLQANNSTLDSIVNRIVGPEPCPIPPEQKRPSPPTVNDLLGDIENLAQYGEFLAQRAHRAIGLP